MTRLRRPLRPRGSRTAGVSVLVAVAAFAELTALTARSQGIPFVTRRTPTIQKQVPARQFFDAAGIAVAGSNAVAGSTSPTTAPALALPSSSAPKAPPALARTPALRGPATAAVPGSSPRLQLPPPGPARGYLVPPAPAATTVAAPGRFTAPRPPLPRSTNASPSGLRNPAPIPRSHEYP